MNNLGYRPRLFLILALFAVVPAALLTIAWGTTMTRILPLMAGKAAWETVSATGSQVIAIARGGGVVHRDSATARRDSAEILAHERSLSNAATRAAQFELLANRAPAALLVASLVLLAALAFVTVRVGGHLSRQLSRPVDELVTWTGMIAHREPLPTLEARGAPEFGVLREGMRRMAAEIEEGRKAALEAERLAAMRETARQVAHELKNPLTPIRFAVARLTGKVPAELADTVAVLDAESARLDRMARSFAQFGRLPDGPMSEVDIAELVGAAVRASLPDEMSRGVFVDEGLAVMGRSDALTRALGNVLLNAVEACGMTGHIEVRAVAGGPVGRGGVTIAVRDNGPGIDALTLPTIWDPYVTHRAGGTGLGLAIVRQSVEAHGGRVEAESTPGHGTEIRIMLPAEALDPSQRIT